MSVYSFENEPILVELSSGTLIPYLYPIWEKLLQIPSLHVAPFLLEKFNKGADLMAPGIITPPGGKIESDIEKHKAVSIKIIGQRHPVAIGVAEMNSDQLNRPNPTGKAVRIISVIGDTLWASGSKKIPPQEEDTDLIGITVQNTEPDYFEIDGDEPEVEIKDEPKVNLEPENKPEEEEEIIPEIEAEVDIRDVRKEQDELLEYCFKAAIKLKLQPNKEKLLPILCSTFYSQLMLASVPNGKILETWKVFECVSI